MEKYILTTQIELEEIFMRALLAFFKKVDNSCQENEIILTVDQTAAYLKIPKGTIYQLTHKREIPFNRVGRSLRFRMSDLNNWLQENKKNTKNEILNKLKNH